MITANELRIIKAEEVYNITKEEKAKILVKKLAELEKMIISRSLEGFTFYTAGNKHAVFPVEKELTEALEEAGYKVSWTKYPHSSNLLYTISWELDYKES